MQAVSRLWSNDCFLAKSVSIIFEDITIEAVGLEFKSKVVKSDTVNPTVVVSSFGAVCLGAKSRRRCTPPHASAQQRECNDYLDLNIFKRYYNYDVALMDFSNA